MNKVLRCLWGIKFVDVGLLRPATVPQLIVEVVKDVDIGLKIPSTLPQVIAKVVDVDQVWPATIPLVIAEDSSVWVDLGHKRPYTLPLIYVCSYLYFQQLAKYKNMNIKYVYLEE